MRNMVIFGTVLALAGLATSLAEAACSGSNGRGWGSGKGNGAFEMTAADKSCTISFPNFIDEAKGTKVPASEVKLTKAPKSGTIGIAAGKGLVYTPKAGFSGQDKFCTRNTAPTVKGTLSGCVTVTVR